MMDVMSVAGWRKGIAAWIAGGTLYLSVPFTWLMGQAQALAHGHRGRVIAGGPGVRLAGAPWADETPPACPYDVLAFHNPFATFTTRGCPNRCPYCAVPRIEGDFRELPTWKPAPVVCDNNILAASKRHFSAVIESLRPFASVDFNQGLDARRFTAWHASEIGRLRGVKLRFALDRPGDERPVADAISLARRHGLVVAGVYVLIGYRDNPAAARARLEWVRDRKLRPWPMRYQPLDAAEKDRYISPGWTDHELRRMVRYYSRLRWLEHIPYEDYQYTGDDIPLLELAERQGREEKCSSSAPGRC